VTKPQFSIFIQHNGQVLAKLKTSSYEHAVDVAQRHALKYPDATASLYYGTATYPFKTLSPWKKK